MITLNLFVSYWWDNSYEINVLKSVNKLYFGQNNQFYLYSCLFPDLKGFQWQKTNATFFRGGGSIHYV